MTPYETVEKLIDKYSVADVLIMIGDICAYKSEHIVHNWQDMPLGLKWLKAEKIVKSAVKKLPKVPGIK